MYIFQSEQVIKLRFWLKSNLAGIQAARSQSIGLSCEVHTGTLYTPKPTNMEWFATGVHW